MNSVRGLMLGLVLSLWLGTSWSHSLTITVENISEAGELHIAIYDSKETFDEIVVTKAVQQPGLWMA